MCHAPSYFRRPKSLEFDLPLKQQTSPGLYKIRVNVSRMTHELTDTFRYSIHNVLHSPNIKKTSFTETIKVA